MHCQDGSSLSVDEQLRRSWQSKTLFTLSHLHVGMRRLVPLGLGLQLFFLYQRRMRLQCRLDAISANHDGLVRRGLALHEQYAHECGVRNHDGNWDD